VDQHAVIRAGAKVKEKDGCPTDKCLMRRPFNHSESCQPLDGSFPTGAFSLTAFRAAKTLNKTITSGNSVQAKFREFLF
jgi:hypothetical protein